MFLTKPSTDRFVFSSSIAADTWHPQKDAKAYEWWYFDALSDDGNEAIIIVFLDNFIYSPRYNAKETNGSGDAQRFPAVSFTYFVNGKVVYRAESEFSADDFSASENEPKCSVGNSGFRFDSASYGSGYLVSVELPLSRGRLLRANLEWLSIESDFDPEPPCYDGTAHCWNMVAPRSDVSGKITVTDARGRVSDTRSFRGTGYHDHNMDNRWLAKTVKEWHWGRAHFADATAVFCRYAEIGQDEPKTQLMLVREGKLETFEAVSDEQDYVRDKYGIRYPTQLSIASKEGLRLETRPVKVIDSSFYHLRFLSSVQLSMPDGREHSTSGITEFIAPRALKYRWLNWLSDLRTGRNGKGSFLR
ncbi:MAG: hypothetical protein HOP17_05640 [Acidobacteria bacterium]|nr:hypothetical protein [Acidobacteriota bacterium]